MGQLLEKEVSQETCLFTEGNDVVEQRKWLT